MPVESNDAKIVNLFVCLHLCINLLKDEFLRMLFRPKNLALRSLLAVEAFSLSSNISPGSLESVLRYVTMVLITYWSLTDTSGKINGLRIKLNEMIDGNVLENCYSFIAVSLVDVLSRFNFAHLKIQFYFQVHHRWFCFVFVWQTIRLYWSG